MVGKPASKRQPAGLPEPEYTTKGRPYAQTTRLGRVMWLRGWTNVYELAGEVKISPRQLSSYLAGERIANHHLIALARELDVPVPSMLQEEENQ